MKKKQDEELENQIEQPEEQPEESKLQRFILENKVLLITAGIVIIAIVGLYIYLEATRMTSSREASLALSRVLPYFEKGNYQLALDGDPNAKVRGQDIIGLKEIVEKYENTSQGRVAALYAANCYVELENIDEARRYFEIASKSDSDLIKTGAYAGLGLYYETKGQFKEAAENYQKAGEFAGESGAKFRYFYFAGLCYEKDNNKERAEQLYRLVIGNNEYSEYLGLAKAGLVRLGTIIE